MVFCPFCGQRQSPSTDQSEMQGPQSSLRLATVLFGDVSGFTEMSEHLPPEEVTTIMNSCFEAISKPILAYDGTIDKYVGDAIMARFGAPHAHEDDPIRAIHAGLEMQEILGSFARNLEEQRGYRLKMRIGINTGQVMATEVGAKGSAQYTLMGSTVNVASRLEHEAEPGTVLVGEATYRLAQHAFEFEAREPMEIRGIKSELVRSYVPLRPTIGLTSGRAGRTGSRLPLVGREAEMAVLDKYLAEVQSGHGRLVALVGNPGLGKSRLADEFWRAHRDDDGVLGIYVSAPSFGESMPYSMLAGFVRGLLFGSPARSVEKVEHSVDEPRLRARLAELLPDQSVALDDAVALLGDLLGVEGVGVANVEARSRQAILTNIVEIILAIHCRRQRMIATIEDVHWVDSASLDVLSQVLRDIASMPVLVLLTHRPRHFDAWEALPYYRRVAVEELDGPQQARLVSEFFGSKAVPEVVEESVLEKAGGNPFFIEQLLSNVKESGALVEKTQSWELARDIGSLSVPDTIQGILLARIDQLPRPARNVLEVAAVIGRIFAHVILRAACADPTVDDQLERLQTQDFVSKKSILPEIEYMFSHSLMQDVTYQGLPEARRRVLHERVAAAIEARGSSRVDEAAALAIHYRQTGNDEKEVESLLVSARFAQRNYANQDALTAYGRALDLLDNQSQADTSLTISVLAALGDINELAADREQARTFYERARDASTAPAQQAHFWRKLGDLSASGGRYAEAKTSYQEAAATLEHTDEAGWTQDVWVEQVGIWLAQARMDRSRGALEEASAALLKALPRLDKIDEATEAALWFERGEIDREAGNLRSASGCLQQAESMWELLGARERQALVASALADVSFNRGELEEALQHYQRAYDLQQGVFDRQGIAATLAGMGRVQIAVGDMTEAARQFTDAMTLATEIDNRLLIAQCMLQLAAIFLEQGNLEKAGAYVDGPVNGEAGAKVRFKEMRNWRGSAYTLLIRARLLRAHRDPGHARSMLQRAANLADTMHDRSLRAQVCFAEAELEEEAGNLDAAAECGEKAISMARALYDTRLVARSERILGRVRTKQRKRKEGLDLLRSSHHTLRRIGARADAARAGLDYAIATRGDGSEQDKGALIEYALSTFTELQSPRDLQIARAVAKQLGLEPLTVA